MKRVKKGISILLVMALLVTVCQTELGQAKAKKAALNKKKVTLTVGKTTKLKVKNNKKKVKWTSSKKKIATVSKKGKVKAKKAGKAVITAKFGKKKLKCRVTVKAKKVKTVVDNRKAVTIENFESYADGYDWPVYTLGEGLTSGGTEKAHYLASGETMKVVTDPENSSNKLLQVKPRFYSFAPVLSIDLAKIAGAAGKKLDNYSGVRAKIRVVSDASAHVSIGCGAFFGKMGTINKKYAFMTYTTQQAALPAERPYYIFFHSQAMAAAAANTNLDHLMPQYMASKSKHTAGHKFAEKDKAVGFATRTLNFTKYLTADLKNQSQFDMVIGGSYGTAASGEYLAWYIDDIQLLEK